MLFAVLILFLAAIAIFILTIQHNARDKEHCGGFLLDGQSEQNAVMPTAIQSLHTGRPIHLSNFTELSFLPDLKPM